MSAERQYSQVIETAKTLANLAQARTDINGVWPHAEHGLLKH